MRENEKFQCFYRIGGEKNWKWCEETCLQYALNLVNFSHLNCVFRTNVIPASQTNEKSQFKLHSNKTDTIRQANTTRVQRKLFIVSIQRRRSKSTSTASQLTNRLRWQSQKKHPKKILKLFHSLFRFQSLAFPPALRFWFSLWFILAVISSF